MRMILTQYLIRLLESLHDMAREDAALCFPKQKRLIHFTFKKMQIAWSQTNQFQNVRTKKTNQLRRESVAREEHLNKIHIDQFRTQEQLEFKI